MIQKNGYRLLHLTIRILEDNLMISKEQEYNRYLQKIAENLDITNTMYEKAISSYTAIGEWLGDCTDDSLVNISPQGSFYFGTVIRPISDKDEYDIDLVCLLKDKHDASEYEIKNLVGDQLKQHDMYRKMLDKEEGKRCWTLHYDEFHMDILPCAPKGVIYSEPNQTEIRLTHKTAPQTYEPKYSNPFKYHEWFEERMKVRLLEARQDFIIKAQAEITDVPLYKIKTPLQRSIQLLKRHRDSTYQKTPKVIKDNAPISIIINTLAAHSYNNETNIFEALVGILNKMQNYIEVRNGVYWIENPAMPEENFADKWRDEPKKRDEFFRWLNRAQEDMLSTPSKVNGIHQLCEIMGESFGSSVVRKSFSDLGHDIRVSRDSGSLYISGLTGGLTSAAVDKVKKVGGHTFFGR
jgi:hypothetical protein